VLQIAVGGNVNFGFYKVHRTNFFFDLRPYHNTFYQLHYQSSTQVRILTTQSSNHQLQPTTITMATKTAKTWQEELTGKNPFPHFKLQKAMLTAFTAECRRLRVPEPQFNIVSERRGQSSTHLLAWTYSFLLQVAELHGPLL
jgi:hypothetical protein